MQVRSTNVMTAKAPAKTTTKWRAEVGRLASAGGGEAGGMGTTREDTGETSAGFRQQKRSARRIQVSIPREYASARFFKIFQSLALPDASGSPQKLAPMRPPLRKFYSRLIRHLRITGRTAGAWGASLG